MAIYNHKQIESQIPTSWSRLCDGTIINPNWPTFAIILPPPNVTGILHLGHAWDGILQDILMRYYKIQNHNLLWVAGMDHAGIATQTKFEKELAQQGKKRADFSRDQFNAMIHAWKDQHAATIRQQWKRLGLALSETNERFTLDDDSVRVVQDSFIQLFNQGLVYRAERLVNWDVQLQTAISNIEVVFKEVKDHLYTIDYVSSSDPTVVLKVATTRPETMFGDVCLVCHPDDARYQQYKGHTFINPANQQLLPLIFDRYVDMTFGTGVMKCTPAHDFNDWNLAKKHQLPIVQCIGLDGKMLANCGVFANYSKQDCRSQLVQLLQTQGLITISDYVHTVGFSERSDVVVEPMLSEQWFVKTSILARKVQQQIINDRSQVVFWPDNYATAIFRYLEQMEDWCISRQLSWGVPIPIWYHKDSKQIVAATDAPGDDWVGETDVFDTWYSSGLWPITTTHSYFNSAHSLQQFYPTNVLVTGVDILFFWVSRMMMFGVQFSGKMPFKNVYLHGLIRDKNNQKMSKSLGNGIDPQTLIDKYGADVLRLFFATYTVNGEDLLFDEAKMQLCQKSMIKLWNAYQFLQLKNIDLTRTDFDDTQTTWAETWILAKWHQLQQELAKNYAQFQFNLVAKKVIEFLCHDFCNWFLEFVKVQSNQISPNTQKVVAFVWKQLLLLLNPIMPFVTCYLYEMIFGHDFYSQVFEQNDRLVAVSKHGWLFGFIQQIRELRNVLKIKADVMLEVVVSDADGMVLSTDFVELTSPLKIVNVQFVTTKHQSQSRIVLVIDQLVFEVLVSSSLAQQYHQKLLQNIQNLEQEVARSNKILTNPNFLAKADATKVVLEQEKLVKYQTELKAYIKLLSQQNG